MTELAAGIRFLHLAACMLLAGHCVALAAVIPRTPSAQHLRATALLRHRRAGLWVTLFILITGAAGVWIQAAALNEVQSFKPGADSASIITLLTETLSGQLALLRFGIAITLLALFRRERTPPTFLTAQTVLSLFLLATVALAGHAAASDGMNFVIEAGIAVAHIVAAGTWLGALLPLAIALRSYADDPNATGVTAVRGMTTAFSRLGVYCVLTLLLTGAVNAAIYIGSVPQLIGTPYGRLLLLKVALLLILLTIAAYNLLRLKPAIESAWPAAEAALPLHARTLARNAMLEAAIGAVVLLVVANLSFTPPARHVQPDWPWTFRWDWSALENPRAQETFQFGLLCLIAGLLMLQVIWLARRYRHLMAVAGVAMMLYGGTLMVQPLHTDAYPTTYWRPDVPYNAISVASGGALYARHCAACHGTSGRGDGPAGVALDPKPADLTARHTGAHTAGDLYWWLTHGKPGTAMPAFGPVIDPDERWDLINFVRALGSGRRARGLAPVVDERPAIAAPDFAYATANRVATLKDHRGGKFVLLVLTAGGASRLKELAAAQKAFDAARIEVLVVPFKPGIAATVPGLSLVTEGNQEIHATYSLLAQGFSDTNRTEHAEFLIDRNGYVRARWLPSDNDAWRDPAVALKQVEILAREKHNAPPPDDHVH